MFNAHNYRNILAAKMPGELSDVLLGRLVADIAIMARNLPPKKLLKLLAWYFHGLVIARGSKSMTILEIADAAKECAEAIVAALQQDIAHLVLNGAAV